VLPDDLQGAGELVENDRLGLHAVALRETLVGHRDRRRRRGAVVWRQHRLEHRRTDRVPTAGDVKRELSGELSHARCATALPLRPDQAQVDIRRCHIGVGH
jgi:hypothetical protein